jgi:teichuronic acid biosynthesis glycosyltransferase TuaG
MTENKVSVIIPAYNSGRTLAAAIDSALAQTVPVEVIVVDDCSEESTDDIRASYESIPNVTFVQNERNRGVAYSRNRGVSLAGCEYVAFLDSDDMWLKNKLELQMKLMKESSAVICSTARELMTEAGEPTGKVIPVPERVTYKQLLYGNVINCSSVLMLKKVAERYPMEDDDVHEDYICWLKILKEYGFSVAVNEPLILYRQTRGSKSGSKLSSAKMTFAVYRKMGFGLVKSCVCFMGYAVNGVLKYFIKS